MTRLERETLARIRERLAIFDPGAAEKLAVLLPVLRRFAQRYAALGPAAIKTIEALLPGILRACKRVQRAWFRAEAAAAAGKAGARADVRPQRDPGRAALYAARGYAGGIL